MDRPTPEQRAELLVRRLEQFIRDGKSEDKGMSFRSWQAMARYELINAFTEGEQQIFNVGNDVLMKRMIICATSTIVTIGFWGSVVSLDRNFGHVAAIITGISLAFLGIIIAEIIVRRISSNITREKRKRRFDRIEAFDRKLKKMDDERWMKLKRLEKEAQKGNSSN